MSSRTEKGLADDTRQSLVEQKVRVTYESSSVLDHVDDFSILDASKYKFYQMIEIRHELLVKLLSRTRAYEVKSVKAEGKPPLTQTSYLAADHHPSHQLAPPLGWIENTDG